MTNPNNQKPCNLLPGEEPWSGRDWRAEYDAIVAARTPQQKAEIEALEDENEWLANR